MRIPRTPLLVLYDDGGNDDAFFGWNDDDGVPPVKKAAPGNWSSAKSNGCTFDRMS